jgi:hypothetical protein
MTYHAAIWQFFHFVKYLQYRKNTSSKDCWFQWSLYCSKCISTSSYALSQEPEVAKTHLLASPDLSVSPSLTARERLDEVSWSLILWNYTNICQHIRIWFKSFNNSEHSAWKLHLFLFATATGWGFPGCCGFLGDCGYHSYLGNPGVENPQPVPLPRGGILHDDVIQPDTQHSQSSLSPCNSGIIGAEAKRLLLTTWCKLHVDGFGPELNSFEFLWGIPIHLIEILSVVSDRKCEGLELPIWCRIRSVHFALKGHKGLIFCSSYTAM